MAVGQACRDMGSAPGRRVWAFALLVLVAACASSGAEARSGGTDAPIGPADLENGGYSSLYVAVRELRPGWLNRINGVFVDGHAVEGIPWLRSVPTDGVDLIELLSCDEAMTRLYVSNCFTGRYIAIAYRR